MAGHGILQNLTSSSSSKASWIWTSLSSVKTEVDAAMPSTIQSLFNVWAVAQTALGLTSPVARSAASCPHPQLSCHNTTAVKNLCCFNSPGGSLLQTQFWDTDPVSGPEDSWTIHGLWPDNCDGTYDSYCDDSRAYTNISDIISAAGDDKLLAYMNKYWTSNTGSAESFWEHEWGKHGTCISTLDPDCYTNYKPTEEVPDFFRRTVNLFKSLPTYTWLKDAGIVPSSSKTYSRKAIQAALKKHHDGMKVYLGCTDDNELDEVWYYFNVRGSIQTGEFVPSKDIGGESTCSETGVKYLPKKKGSGGSPTTTSTTSSTPAPTGAPFSGKGYLNVITSGSEKGCIISGGTWYTTGTCAGFTVSDNGDGFTLTSSKGDCAVSNGALTCGSSVSSASTFTADGSNLVYDDSSDFYADSVPSGSTQGTVYTSGDGHSVELSIEWQSI